jgi:acyl dehydratase
MESQMSASAAIQEITPYPGFRLKQRTMIVDADEETRLLGHCGIDFSIYNGNVDPAAFISLAIQEGVRNGMFSNGAVNMVQTIVQTQPLQLGADIIVTGEVLTVEQSARGRVTTSETWFANADGERGITAMRRGVMTNPDAPSSRGAGDRPPAVIEDVSKLKEIGSVTLTPEHVKGYGAKTSNFIHVDPEAARRAGYRAPIIGGGQGVRYITAAIWRHFSPKAVDLEIYFRRPLFWDDSFSIRVDERDGTWKAACLAKGDRVATEVRINHIA